MNAFVSWLVDFLKSPFFVSLVGVLVSMLVVLVPELEPHKGTLISLILAVVGIIVGAQVVNNAVAVNAETQVTKAQLAVKEAQAYAVAQEARASTIKGA